MPTNFCFPLLSFALAIVLQGCETEDSTTDVVPTPDPCAYNFTKPSCNVAGVQAPRNVSKNSKGLKEGLFSPLTNAQRSKLRLANIHFHLGAEHYSEGEYMHKDDSATDDDVRAGFMCDAPKKLQAEDYKFEFCKGVEVGKTYEVHYVWSTAGADPENLDDGLGQAANGRNLLNPFIVVQAQVFVIVNDENRSIDDDMTKGWNENLAKTTGVGAVSYAGSTTGTSHNNNVCSPYAISWHVDRACHQVHAASFDNMCKMLMENHEMHLDLAPHGSRELVDSKYVVPWDEVTPLFD